MIYIRATINAEGEVVLPEFVLKTLGAGVGTDIVFVVDDEHTNEIKLVAPKIMGTDAQEVLGKSTYLPIGNVANNGSAAVPATSNKKAS